MTQPLKTTDELIELTTNVISSLQAGNDLDDVLVLSIFEQITHAFTQDDKSLQELQALKDVLDLLSIELANYENRMTGHLSEHRTRATAHKAYISSTKR